jgi:hypothetical protein
LIYAHHGDRFAPLPELLAEIFFRFSIQLSAIEHLDNEAPPQRRQTGLTMSPDRSAACKWSPERL